MYHKAIVDRNAVKRINQLAERMRKFFYESTLPWTGSARVLPMKNYDGFVETMEELISET